MTKVMKQFKQNFMDLKYAVINFMYCNLLVNYNLLVDRSTALLLEETFIRYIRVAICIGGFILVYKVS